MDLIRRKILHRKGNHKQNEKETGRQSMCSEVTNKDNFQYIQTAQTTQ